MKARRIPLVVGTSLLLLVVRPEQVVGQAEEACLLEMPVAVPTAPPVAVSTAPPVDVPRCGELPVPVSVPGPPDDPVPTSVLPLPPAVPPGVPAPPPAPARGGCLAVDPGTPVSSFTAVDWIEVEVYAVLAQVSGGVGFTGAGYDPPKHFSVVLPSEPGARVTVRAIGGWVVAYPYRHTPQHPEGLVHARRQP